MIKNTRDPKQPTAKKKPTYLTANGVAGSTFGFCFWTGSSSCLLFQPSQPLATEGHKNYTNGPKNIQNMQLLQKKIILLPGSIK